MSGNWPEAVREVAREDYVEENIYLFWPNILSYIRIVLLFASLYYMPLHPRSCSGLYSISCLLDALAGYVARRYKQQTRFGAVLDMVTDRCTTACLLVFLASAWPRWSIVFQGLMALDLASHYVHMFATLIMGGVDSSHKKVEKQRSFLLHLYYTDTTVLFLCCALNELFFIALYLVSFSSQPPPLTSSPLQIANSGTTTIHQSASVDMRPSFADPYSAGALEFARADKMDPFWPLVFLAISCPIMFLKQFINILQLITASQWLAEGDREMRRAAKLPRKLKQK